MSSLEQDRNDARDGNGLTMLELNNMLLSRLLRYHADVEICVRDHDGIDEVSELVRLGLLYPTTDNKTACDFHALTKLGRRVTGVAIESARLTMHSKTVNVAIANAYNSGYQDGYSDRDPEGCAPATIQECYLNAGVK